MKTQSLTTRTVSIVLAAQFCCALILCGAALVHERHTRLRALDMSLQGKSDSLLGAIQDAEDPEDNVHIDPAELKVLKEDVYAVYSQDGRLLGTSADAPGVLTVRGSDAFHNVSFNGVPYRVFQRSGLRIIDRAETSGVGIQRPVTIVYASPEKHVWHEIFEAAGFYLVAVILATITTAALVTLVLRKAFRPLAELALAAEQLSPPTLRFQAPASVMQTRELLPLAAVLTEAVKRLKASFAKEQRFVGDAAHELKTAIAVVRSSVQVLMLKRRTPAEYETGLGRVLEDNKRVEALVNQMLLLARLEESPADLSPALDLDSAIALAAGKLSSIAEDRQVELRVDGGTGAMARISPEAAETLVSNLLLNALQHSRPSTAVTVQTFLEGPTVCLVVSDKGSGISAEALPHVFERFYREDTSRSRETGGTGLGLAICKSVTEAADGKIEIQSTLGVGTKVRVTFSLA